MLLDHLVCCLVLRDQLIIGPNLMEFSTQGYCVASGVELLIVGGHVSN